MHVTIVQFQVKTERIAAFIEATRLNHEASVREPGNRRFDVLQSPEDPTRFVFYEAYASDADARAHRETPHFLAWRKTVENWLVKPGERRHYLALFPQIG